MALTVVVRCGDTDSAPTITLDAPRVVIGRGDGCDVRLPDPSVSHRHASLRQRGAEYLVIDEGSTNGTFVGQVRLSPQAPRVVQSGDLIRVGRVWLELRIEHVPVSQKPQVVTQEIALALVASALRAEGEGAVPKVRIRSGPDAGQELCLEDFGEPYLIGRGSGTALCVTDDDASRHHVELHRRGSRIYVRDLGSKNGSRLGDEALQRDAEVPWPVGMTLHVGNNQLEYEDPVTVALQELEGVADERMRDDVSVAPPDSGTEPDADPGPGGSAPTPEPPRAQPAPRAAARRRSTAPGWGTTDLLVALLALVVMALSGVGIWWMFGQ